MRGSVQSLDSTMPSADTRGMRIPFAFILSALLAVGLAAQQQQNQFEQQVRKQLDNIGADLKKKGFELTYQVHTGSLKAETAESVTFRLRRGVRYALVGVCDQDCGDLDLRLLDPGDREIGKDVEKDDVPVVELTADKTGEYTLKVEMQECSDQPCAYGVAVFATEQDAFDRQVQEQLGRAGRDLGTRGFTLTHQVFTGSLKEGETENVVFEFDSSGSYVVVGVCDNDCKDVDLKLLDSRGREIDNDVQEDDAPVVAVTPKQRERFTVQAIMADCNSNPCRYGLGVFRK